MLSRNCKGSGKWFSDVLIEWLKCPECDGKNIGHDERVGMDRTFHIKRDHTGYAIELETNEPQFKSLEMLMYRIASHFIEKGRADDLKRIKGLIEAKLIR